MFLTQPPVSAMLLFVTNNTHGPARTCATLFIMQGITLGIIADTLAQMLNQLSEKDVEESKRTGPPGLGGIFLTDTEH